MGPEGQRVCAEEFVVCMAVVWLKCSVPRGLGGVGLWSEFLCVNPKTLLYTPYTLSRVSEGIFVGKIRMLGSLEVRQAPTGLGFRVSDSQLLQNP